MTNSLPNSSVISPPRTILTMKEENQQERKRFGSPMTTQTDMCSYDDDDENSMNSSPMRIHMGRVDVSSCSSSMDGSDEDGQRSPTTRSSISSGSSHRRRLNLPPSMNRSSKLDLHNENDTAEALLIGALHQLQKLATLDSSEYQQRLLENTLPKLELEPTGKSSLCYPSLATHKTTSTSAAPVSELSPPLQTPLMQLSMSIHRLHAVVANITKETDGHTDEVQELQSQLTKMRSRNQRLESAAKMVHQKNLKLKQQAKQDQKTIQELRQKAKDYEAQLESQGFQLMASKVQQHEIVLQLKSQQQQSQISVKSVESSIGGESSDKEDEEQSAMRRQRMDSSMSDFLNVELDIENDDKSNQSVLTSELNSPLRSKSEEAVEKEQDQQQIHTKNSFSDQSQNDCPSASSSVTSSKSQGGGFRDILPTLRISKEGSSTPGREEKSDQDNDSSQAGGLPAVAKTNTNPDSKEQVQGSESSPPPKKAPVDVPHQEKPPPATTKLTSKFNRFTNFLGSRAVSNYNLKMTAPCNMQFVALPLRTNENATKSPSAFAVCGLKGFNEEVNMKPTLGARLAKINGKEVGEDWTLEKLYEELDAESANTKKIVLTFRNETWSPGQSKVFREGLRNVENNSSSNSTPDAVAVPNQKVPEETHQRTNILDDGERWALYL